MVDENGVKTSAPDGSSKAQSDEGKIPYEELAKRYDHEKKERERMGGALQSLQSERDEIAERLEKLETIEERRELTAREEAEKLRLESGHESIEDQIESLKRNPKAKPWMTHLERELSRATKTASNEALVVLAGDFLEESAEELSGDEEYKGMTDEKLLKLIKPYFGQFETKSVLRKTKLAFKAWKEDVAFRKDKQEIAKKKAAESSTREGDGRLARESSTQELLGKKGSLEGSERSALREKL